MENGQSNRAHSDPGHDGAARPAPRSFDDQRMEIVMGRILQIGVLLASAVVVVGGVLSLLADGAEKPAYGSFHPAPYKLWLLHPGALLAGVGHGNAMAIIQLGIVLLIATPIARVVCAVVAFSLERDRLYVGVSVFVLAVLVWGMLRGG